MGRKIRTFGEYLRTAREARGLTLRGLSGALGGAPNHAALSFWENGNFQPSKDKTPLLRQMARILAVDAGELFLYAGVSIADMTELERHAAATVLARIAAPLEATGTDGGAGPQTRRRRSHQRIARLPDFSGYSSTSKPPAAKHSPRVPLARIIPLRRSD